MSDRRLATLASLLGLTLLVYAMVGARVAYSGSPHYGALVWNLFLAWIPLVLALAVYDGYRRGASRVALLAGGGLWLLFFPNAPYIVTDLKHLRTWDGMPILYDVVLASAAAWAGLAIGFVSLFLMQRIVRRLAGAVNAWFFVLAVLALSSFGIYLGRVRRWNSWDIFFQPTSLLADVWAPIAHPFDHPRTVALTMLLTAFLAATYLVFYSFMSLSSPSREATRR
jgi:uncharacterized membrane protein